DKLLARGLPFVCGHKYRQAVVAASTAGPTRHLCSIGAAMTTPATTSLLDRANLDRDAIRREITRGLAGADDGELFLEYGQTEALMFDNGRLKQATYDTSQGFGLR